MNGTNSSARHYGPVVIGSSAPDITAPRFIFIRAQRTEPLSY